MAWRACRAARRDGVTWAVRLGVLRAAGLEAVTWRLDESVEPDVLAATVDAGCALRAVITWSADTTPETWTEQLSRVGAAELTSLCVEGWLPEGALVEPGSPSTHEWLVAVSAARLMSAPGAHIEAFPLGLGADVAQLALTVGADDFGWVGSVSASAPTAQRRSRSMWQSQSARCGLWPRSHAPRCGLPDLCTRADPVPQDSST